VFAVLRRYSLNNAFVQDPREVDELEILKIEPFPKASVKNREDEPRFRSARRKIAAPEEIDERYSVGTDIFIGCSDRTQ